MLVYTVAAKAATVADVYCHCMYAGVHVSAKAEQFTVRLAPAPVHSYVHLAGVR